MSVELGGVSTTVSLAQANAAQGAKVLKQVSGSASSSTSNSPNRPVTLTSGGVTPAAPSSNSGSPESSTLSNTVQTATQPTRQGEFQASTQTDQSALRSQLAARAAQISTKVL